MKNDAWSQTNLHVLVFPNFDEGRSTQIDFITDIIRTLKQHPMNGYVSCRDADPRDYLMQF